MAKPRVFISSTYFDLKQIRKNLELFIDQMGYEPVLFESGDIPFEDKVPLDISCYKEIESCHIQILIIGGRYGSSSSDKEELDDDKILEAENQFYAFYNSITKKEFLKARELGIPVFIFVQKGVLAEYETYKKNKDNTTISYAHVDSVNIFKLLDDIFLEKVASFVKDFENFDDIQMWLKDQWAGLFANYLSRNISEHQIKNLSGQVNELSLIVSSLKEYSEAIMRTIKPENYEKIIHDQDDKLHQLILLNELKQIDYIDHLTTDHNIKLEDIFNALVHSITFKDFQSSLKQPSGRPLSCLFGKKAKVELNQARLLLNKDIFEFPLNSEKDFIYNEEEIVKPIRYKRMQTISKKNNSSK